MGQAMRKAGDWQGGGGGACREERMGRESLRLGRAANRLPGPDYHMVPGLTDAAAVCNKEKTFPSEWITPDGCGIRPEFISYALPLIQGEPPRAAENGLPRYLYRHI